MIAPTVLAVIMYLPPGTLAAMTPWPVTLESNEGAEFLQLAVSGKVRACFELPQEEARHQSIEAGECSADGQDMELRARILERNGLGRLASRDMGPLVGPFGAPWCVDLGAVDHAVQFIADVMVEP